MSSFSTSFYEKIADGVAEEGISVIDDFLSEIEVGRILDLDDFKNGLLQFKKAAIGQEKQIQEAVRGDYIQWIDRSNSPDAVRVFLDRLEGLMLAVNRALFLSLKDYEVHKTIYPEGTYYKRHIDQFKTAGHRKLSIICYLNKGWKDADGGQLRVYLPSGARDIFPIAGRLVCFRSDNVEHEVLPATRNRLSLTGWILDEFADVKYLRG